MRTQALVFGFGTAIGLASADTHAQTVRLMEVRHTDGSPTLFLAGEYGSSSYDPTPIVAISDDEIGIILYHPFIGFAVGTTWELTVPLQVPSAGVYRIRVCGHVEVCQSEDQVGFLRAWIYSGVSIFRSSFEQ